MMILSQKFSPVLLHAQDSGEKKLLSPGQEQQTWWRWGDCYHWPLKKLTKEEAALLTAVVVRPINTLQNVEGEFYSFAFFVSHSSSSSLAVSHSGHTWTIVFTAPMIFHDGWRYDCISSTSISYQWMCRIENKHRVPTEGGIFCWYSVGMLQKLGTSVIFWSRICLKNV